MSFRAPESLSANRIVNFLSSVTLNFLDLRGVQEEKQERPGLLFSGPQVQEEFYHCCARPQLSQMMNDYFRKVHLVPLVLQRSSGQPSAKFDRPHVQMDAPACPW